MAKKRIHELTSLASPTDGWEIPLDKSGEATAKKLKLSDINKYDTGNGFLGCYRELYRIGQWKIKNTNKYDIVIPNPETVIGIGNVFINDDDDNQYMNTLWDDTFFIEARQAISLPKDTILTGTSDSANNGATASANTGATGTAGTGTTSASNLTFAKVLMRAVAQSDSSLFLYHPFGAVGYSIVNVGGGQIRVNYPHAGENYLKVYPLGNQAIMMSVENYTGYSIIRPTNENGDAESPFQGAYMELVSAYTYDDHVHALTSSHTHDLIGSHTHDLSGTHTHPLSVTGSILTRSGSFGYNINVFAKWSPVDGKVYLTHNCLGSLQARFLSFGVFDGANLTAYLNKYQNPYKNRGYIEIIRKFA
jgi:hypothetical protein